MTPELNDQLDKMISMAKHERQKKMLEVAKATLNKPGILSSSAGGIHVAEAIRSIMMVGVEMSATWGGPDDGAANGSYQGHGPVLGSSGV